LTPSSRRKPVGLLAGWGTFPLVFAEKARAVGLPVVCIGIRGEASTELARACHRFWWAGAGKMQRVINLFKDAGVEQIVMAGKIHKANILLQPWLLLRYLPDWRTIRWFYNRRRRDNKDDTLLLSLIDEFAKDGLHFTSALELCPELLAPPGVLTRRAPTARDEADIAFGWELAREMGRLDVGQSVAVKDRMVLAVEAIEGTDRAIARAGTLCRSGGFTVVKVAKPHQDMRFDVPTVGLSTVETLHAAGGRVLAIEAGKTIVLDQAATVTLADRLGLTITALNEPPTAA
jgi:DUF1009 family protein